MRRLGNWSVILGTLAFATLPVLAAGCAENQSTATPPAATDTAEEESGDDLGALSDDLGAPGEAGSGLGLPEAGSALE